jgi:GT2 family glycosyltransferase
MTRVAVLIPVYNHLDYTIKAINDLLQIGNSQLDLIVIDDGSVDGTYNWLINNAKEVKVLKGNGNLWWSGAINLGAKYAIEQMHADYLLLWNNDITFQPDYFEKLFKIVAETDTNTVIGSKILVNGSPETIWSMGGCFNPRNGKYNMYGYFKKDNKEFCQIKNVDWLTGMGTLVPVGVIEKIGYWDQKNFPQYHGDSDFTYRAKLAGFKIIVHPELIIFNNVKNSGIEHNGNLKQLFRLFTDLRSKSNFGKKLIFYKLHSQSIFAYYPLVLSYFKIIGGFFKWKLFHLIGIKK